MDNTFYIIDIDKTKESSINVVQKEINKYLSPEFMENFNTDIYNDLYKGVLTHGFVKDSAIFIKEQEKALICRLTTHEDWQAMKDNTPPYESEENILSSPYEFGTVLQMAVKENEVSMVLPNGRFKNLHEYKYSPETDEVKILFVGQNSLLSESDKHWYEESAEFYAIKRGDYSIHIVDEIPDRSRPFFRCNDFNYVEGFGKYTKRYFELLSPKRTIISKCLPLNCICEIEPEKNKDDDSFQIEISNNEISLMLNHKEVFKTNNLDDALTYISKDSKIQGVLNNCPVGKKYLDKFIESYKIAGKGKIVDGVEYNCAPYFVLEHMIDNCDMLK